MPPQPQPRPDDREPGSTPGGGRRPNVELERQRAEGDDERTEVPPTESVPDEVAEEAARSVDPAARPHRPGARDADPDDPLRPAPSSTNTTGTPRHER